MTDSRPKEYTLAHVLTAGETDAAGRMPVTLIVARAIEAATLHANALNIGYADLKPHGLGWVLARISVEMDRFPGINEHYSITTWIEGVNKYFSDRCYEIRGADGLIIGRIRSMWVAIDTVRRSMADLSTLGGNFLLSSRGCKLPACRPPRHKNDAELVKSSYCFRYTDIDFNGHVNTLRYIEAVLNQHDTDFYANHRITALEASFEHECRYGQTVTLVTDAKPDKDGACTTEIITPEGQRAVAIRLSFNQLEQS